ncbi:MAG: RNA 3'-terminal phosphate cyclase [Haloarculaceae archaeon]
MLNIDGSEGGGQLLRTALSLAAITETAFRIEEIRGSRPNPGLRPQHLAAVELVATLADAEVDGAELGADSLTFEPGEAWTTDIEVSVGTAGSVTLLFDAVLPVAVSLAEPVRVTATGGTNVKWSPTVEYLRRVKLPLLARFGLDAEVHLARTGFYPEGGGEATLRTTPSSLSPISLTGRGNLDVVEVDSIAAESLADQEVAERQADRAEELLVAADLPAALERVDTVESDCPGSSLLLRGVYAETLLGVDELGEPGRPSEEVAERAVEAFERVHAAPGAVDYHMADQLVIFLALAGGEVRIPGVTDHVETNLEVVRQFGSDLSLTEGDGEAPTLRATPL